MIDIFYEHNEDDNSGHINDQVSVMKSCVTGWSGGDGSVRENRYS